MRLILAVHPPQYWRDVYKRQHIDDEQKNLEMMFLEYVEQINANIGMIDRNSTITVRGRNLKMLRIQVPDWETEKEHFRLKLHDYFEHVVKMGICLLYTSRCV